MSETTEALSSSPAVPPMPEPAPVTPPPVDTKTDLNDVLPLVDGAKTDAATSLSEPTKTKGTEDLAAAPAGDQVAPVEASAKHEPTEAEKGPLGEMKAREKEYQEALTAAPQTILSAVESQKWEPVSAGEGQPSAVDGRNAALAIQQAKTPKEGREDVGYDLDTKTYVVYLEQDGKVVRVESQADLEDTIAALQDIAGSDLLEEGLKNQAGDQVRTIEARLNQIKALNSILPEFNLEGKTEEVVGVLNKIATGDLDPATAFQQLKELGGRAEDKLPEKGASLSEAEQKMYQGVIDADPNLKTRGITTPEQLHAAILALTDPNKRENTKGDKLSWVLMALYYLLMGVGAMSQTTADVITSTEASRRQ